MWYVNDVCHGRWETSESPYVHYVQDKLDGAFAESDAASCMKYIRMYDPSFDTVEFLNLLRRDVATVLRSFLSDDKATLKGMCAKDFSIESVQNALLQDDFSKLKREGASIDSRILDVGEVDMLGMEMIESSPHILVRVTSQQIECIRDKSGKVIRVSGILVSNEDESIIIIACSCIHSSLHILSCHTIPKKIKIGIEYFHKISREQYISGCS